MADTASPTLKISTAVTADKHGAQLVVIAILGLIATLLVFANRLVLRWPWKQRSGIDDHVCVAATCSAIVQTAIILVAISCGFGDKPSQLDANDIETIEKLVYGANIIFVLTLCLSKLAVGCLFIRLSPRRAASIITYTTIAYGFVGILIVALSKDIAQPWKVVGATSTSTLPRWATVEAMGMALDIALIVFPAVLVHRLKMGRSTKIAVFLGFALRFPAIIFAALRVEAMATMNYEDFTYSYIRSEIWGQVEMHYNVVAATIPCLRMFLKGWNTSFISTTLKEMDHEAYTVHSSQVVGSPRQSKNSRSAKSKRLSWRSRQENVGVIFDGNTHRTEFSISSERVGTRQVSAGSKHSITVQHSINIDIK